MKVLVIGGQGYIGSYLVPYLTENNILTTCYGSRELDYNKLDKSYLEVYTHIIILAGHSSVQMCLDDLQSPWKNNVRNLKNIIDKTNKDQTIIYASSASVYGNKGTKLYTEEDISVDFVNNYDLTKVTIDLLASKYMTQGRKIIGLRFGTVNGGSSVIRNDQYDTTMHFQEEVLPGVDSFTNTQICIPNGWWLSIDDVTYIIDTLNGYTGL